jgi:LAO/AO transport system kinase
MLDLGGMHEWRPTILETVASNGTGVEALFEAICEHRRHLESSSQNAHIEKRTKAELEKVLSAMLRSRVSGISNGARYEEQVAALIAGTTDPYKAAEALLSEA